jgi:hypothetical protein
VSGAEQLAEIRAVLARVLDDEFADRQYALEQIEEIANRRPELTPRIDGSIPATAVLLDGSAVLSPDDLRTVLDALSVAADDKRDRAENCTDCDGAPAGSADICGTCEWRLRLADEYDTLAAKLTGDRQ